MEKLSHPNIIRLYEVIKTPTHIYIVTEYASGGDLYTHITDHGKMAENEVKCIFAQITAAVDHMVMKNFISLSLQYFVYFFSIVKE
jgi:serine/threonine protein kinase